MRESGLPISIALDATYSVGSRLTGVGVYSRRVLDGLAAAHPEVDWIHCFRSQRFWKGLQAPAGTNVSKRLLWGPLIPRNASLFHGLNQRLPPGGFKFAVTTFHDLFVLTGEYSTPEFRDRFAAQARDAALRSDLIICVSQFTASQVEDLLEVPRKRLRVVPHGVDLPDAGHIAPLSARENLVLFVGALQTRKNLVRLIQAFEQMDGKWSLVLAGSSGFGSAAVLDSVAASRAQDRIRITGYVDAHELSNLYNRARILAFPSLDEGFGIPVLEAMAWGLPVLTSNRSGLVDAAGDCAHVVNPESVEEITDGLRRLTEDSALNRELVARGRIRAAAYSWRLTAERTWEVYKELL